MLITDRWGDSLQLEDDVLRIWGAGPNGNVVRHAHLSPRGRVQLAAVLRGKVNRYRVDDVEAIFHADISEAYVKIGSAEVALTTNEREAVARALVPVEPTEAGTNERSDGVKHFKPPKQPQPARSSSRARKPAQSGRGKAKPKKGVKKTATKTKARKSAAVPKKGTTLFHRRSGAEVEVLGTTTKPDGVRRVRLLNLDTGRETKIKPSGIPNNYES